jgi:hypothetical protein
VIEPREEFRAIAGLLSPRVRARAKILLAGPPDKRAKFVSTLPHFDGFEQKYLCTPLGSGVDLIAAELLERGAQHSCHVISEDDRIDRAVVDLSCGLAAILGSGFGTILIARPGRLLFYEGEMANRFLVHKP